MGHTPEYEVEDRLIGRFQELGYEYADIKDYRSLMENFRQKIFEFNKDTLMKDGGITSFSDTEFERIKTYMEGHSVYASAKILRDRFHMELDNGNFVYLDLISNDTDRNIYQVANQIRMEKEQKEDVDFNNRYDVTVLINGIPIVQVELKRPGVEINEAINQINRYRKFSFRGIFSFLQLFVVSNSCQTKYFCNENVTNENGFNKILKSLVFYWTDDKNNRINDLYHFAGTFFNKVMLTDLVSKYYVIKETEETLMVMRPYQIYAVKAAMRRILESNLNGYVFACTGSGKTLTSYKLAQLLRNESQIDLVVFLVDRKDLDDQTIREYNSYEKGCVNETNNTYTLVKKLKDTSTKMVVTTIQKMDQAVKSERYANVMNGWQDKKVVFIIDECHRSQFGDMHSRIKRYFKNANYIGFTGTPIFEENKGQDGRTTADIFNSGSEESCIHKYMINHAIADGNVLAFSVEYLRSIHASGLKDPSIDPEMLDDKEYCERHKIDMKTLYKDPERIAEVAKNAFEHNTQNTRIAGDTYTAMFAVEDIDILGKYYDEFKKLNEQADDNKKLKIAAIFTYNDNENMEGRNEHSAELLSRIIRDYNQEFKTSYSIDTFNGYRQDIQKRINQKELPQIDILLVVNMLLTGFDAKPLNTLYLDKEMQYHNLVQAYSRTNRVDKLTKQFGHIVTYRNIKKDQDKALALFSGNGDPNAYLLENYNYYVKQWYENEEKLRKIAPDVDTVGDLERKGEDATMQFVLAFRKMSEIMNTLKTFSKFDWDDLYDGESGMSEDEFEKYKGWYITIKENTDRINNAGKHTVLADVDFSLELVRTDRINVMYILNLLRSAMKENMSESQKKESIDLILRDVDRSDNNGVRMKKEIINRFINEKFFNLNPGADVGNEFHKFCDECKLADIEDFSYENGFHADEISKLIRDYEFTGEKLDETVIRKMIQKKGMGIVETKRAKEKVVQFIVNIYDKYKSEDI